jgi:phage/plasmid-associated DNA primase
LFDKKAKVFKTGFVLPKHKWGRIAGFLSLSVAHRPTRHSLCEDEYVDVDMINAQPTIISAICKHNDLVVPFINEYIEKREEILMMVMEHHKVNRDVAKNLPIVLMFGGSYNGWMKEHNVLEGGKIDKFVGMENELKTVMELVYSYNKHIEVAVLKQDAKKWKTADEKKRGVMGLWSQSLERLLQECAISYLVRNKHLDVEEIVPCQDGFMIRRKYWNDEWIEEINNEMVKEYNIPVKYKVKPFDEAYEIPPYTTDKTIAEWEDLLSVKKLADRFYEEFKQMICWSDGNLYVYWGLKVMEELTINGRHYEIFKPEMMNARWYNETDEKKRYKTIRYISDDLHKIMWEELASAVELSDEEYDKLFKTLRMNTSGNKMKEVITHILPVVEESPVKFDSSSFLIGFENGVYDLIGNEFREYTYNDYMTMSVGYDYKDVNYGVNEEGVFIDESELGEDVKEEVMRNRGLMDELVNIIETIQPDADERQLFCQILASGLDGKLYQKMYLFNGQGGNGKGLTSSLMKNILGDYFVAPTNGLLKEAEKANTPSPDMLSLKNKRYINFKEVGGNIKSAIVRNFTGGGDFTGRKLHQNPEVFKMCGTFVMEFNNAPDLDGKPQPSDYRRLTHIQFPINFTDNPSKIGKVIGGVQYKQANPYYESEAFIESMRYVFLNFLIQVYTTFQDKDKPENGIKFIVPKSVIDRSERFITEQDLFNRVIYENFEKVDVDMNDKKDKASKSMKMRDIWETFEGSKEFRKMSVREQREYSRDEFYKWIETQGFIVEDIKKVKTVFGIQRKYNDDEEGEVGSDGSTVFNA